MGKSVALSLDFSNSLILAFVRFRVGGGIVRLRATSLLSLPDDEVLGKKSRG